MCVHLASVRIGQASTAVQAPEQVAGEVAVAAQPSDLLIGPSRRHAKVHQLGSQCGKGVWPVLYFIPADRAEVCGGVGAVIQPVLLLPADETRGASGDLLQDVGWYVTGSAADIGELSRAAIGKRQLPGGTSVGDATKTEHVGLPAEDGADVAKRCGLPAEVAWCVCRNR